jgi:hypothetical protein
MKGIIRLTCACLCFLVSVAASTAHGRFGDNGDGTVTDTSTGLMWQQATAPGTYAWWEARSYCEGLTVAGYTDWRLPTINELDSIVDRSRQNPAIDTAYFPDTRASAYWSSTFGYNQWGESAWGMGFYEGDALIAFDFGSYLYVRAVRGGQTLLLGNLAISSPRQGDHWDIGAQKRIAWDTASIPDNVRISLSRHGGKPDTFYEVIEDNMPNIGLYTWTVTGPESSSCALRIEPVSDATKGTTQSLFSIAELKNAYVYAEKLGSPRDYKMMLTGLYYDGVGPIETICTTSDNSVATISNGILTGLKNGYIEVSTSYRGKTYTKGLFVYTTLEAAETESNNTKAEADVIQASSGDPTLSRFYKGKVLSEDVDWFRFNLGSNSLVNFGYLSESNIADVQVDLYDSADTLLASSVSLNGQPITFPLGFSAGTYYIRLSSAGDIDQDNPHILAWKMLGSLPTKVTEPLSIGDTKSGTINTLRDKTEFTFTLAQDQEIEISFTPSGESAKYHLELLDKNEEVIDQIDCLQFTPVSFTAVYPAGSYTLRVTPMEVVDAVSPFTLSLSASTGQLEKEQNDTPSEATVFDITEPITGRLSSIGDSDFYVFNLDTPRFLEMNFAVPGSTGNFSLTLFKDSEQNEIDGIDIQNGQTTSLHMGLSVGRYFLRVRTIGGSADTLHNYTLTVRDSSQTDLEIESNNTSKFANAIGKDQTKRGRIYAPADIDHFGFHLPEDAFFTVHFLPSTTVADYKVSIVNENGMNLETYFSTNGVSVNIEDAYYEAGNYYIKVEPNGDIDQYKTYNLSLTSGANITGLKQLASVTVSGTKQAMITNETQTVAAMASYSDATATPLPSAVWSSLNLDVATVNEVGLVTAVTEGSTSIVATFGGLSGKFDVVVGAPAQTVSQHFGNLVLVAGGGADITNTLRESTQYLSDLVPNQASL